MADGFRHPREAASSGSPEGLVRFGAFVLDLRTGELRKAGAPLKLQPRPSCVLALLVSSPGQLLTREEIQRQVWPDGTFVDFELSLNTCIRQIRVALGDDADTPRFVETVPRRGYRFVAPVERIGPEDALGRTTSPTRKRSILRAAAVAGVAVALAIATGLARSAHSTSSVSTAASITYRRLTFRRGSVSGARFGPGGQVVYTAAWSGSSPLFYQSDAVNAESRPLDVGGDSIVSVSSRGELAYMKGLRLSRVPLVGGAPKDILEGVWAADSMAGGSEFAIARAGQEELGIEFPIGTVLCKAVRPSDLRISPDGKGVAFLEHPVAGDDRGLVAYVDRQGHKRQLSDGWASIEGLAWRPDSREVWFTAARTGSDSGLHAVDLVGHERDVAPGIGRLVLQDIAPDGKILLVRGDTTGEIRYAGRGDVGERDLSWLDFSTLRDMSADGQTILFEESGQGGGSEYSVFVRRTDRSPAMRIGHGLSRALSPDGRWALTVPAEQPDRIEVIPVGEGEPRILRDPSIKRYGAAEWLPGGLAIVFTGVEQDGAARVFWQALTPEAGSPRPITPKGAYGASHMLTPDGARVLATCDAGYCLYAVDGKSPALHVAGVNRSYTPLCWGDSGRALYFSEALRPFRKLYRLDLAAGRLKPWKTIEPPDAAGFEGLLGFLTTPDEQAYAYSYRRTVSQLYLVANVS